MSKKRFKARGNTETSGIISKQIRNILSEDDNRVVSLPLYKSIDGSEFPSFNEMFDDAKGSLDFTKLDSDHCYTFVLRHPENRIVMKYNTADIILVQMRNINTFETLDNVSAYNMLKETGMELYIPNRYIFNTIEEITNCISSMSWEYQGIVFKHNNFRYKLRNEQYNYVKQLRGNNSKAFYNYLELRNNKMIKHYLQYFPEESHLFTTYRDDYNSIRDDIFIGYLSHFVHKNKELQDISYPLRPILYELHKNYIETQERTTMKVVSDYLHQMDGKRIAFIHNYLFT